MPSMKASVPTYTHTAYAFPIKEWLMYLFLAASPFYMFAVFADRDWPTLWVMLAIFFFLALEFLYTQGKFWYDRSFTYLALFISCYLLSALIVLFTHHAESYLGRTPEDRALTVTIRALFAGAVYLAFVNCMAGCSERSYRKIFYVQMMVGTAIAMFGIVQYVSFVGFSYDGLTHIAPTNETYALQSSFLGRGSQRIYRAAAIYNEPSIFGFFLAPFLVKAVVARAHNVIIGNTIVHGLLIVTLTTAIAMNLSLTAVLSVVFVTFVFVAYSLRGTPYFGKFLLASLVLLVLFMLSPLGSTVLQRLDVVFGLRDPSTLDRVFRAYTAFEVFLQSPVFGIGPGGYAFWYPKLKGFIVQGMASPLNMWLSFLTDAGIFAFIAFLVFLGNILRRAYRARARHPLLRVYLWSLFCYLVLLTTIDIWYSELFWFELAMLLSLASSPFLSSMNERPVPFRSSEGS
jgi:O-antigen ligase